MKVCSMFSQLLPLIRRDDFNLALRQSGGEKGAKGFSSWDQCVAMLFCQLGRAHSLREICGGLASCAGKVVHLGMLKAPSRSTLAYANEKRSYRTYELLFSMMVNRFSGEFEGQHKFRFKNKLISLDATIIDLSLEMYDWAHFRQTKGAVKLHLQLDHDGYMPCFAVITTGKDHEIKVARAMQFQPGTIVVFDRGYTDFGWWAQLHRDKVLFVTRPKTNLAFEVVEERPAPKAKNVLHDQMIRLTGQNSSRDYPELLRLVTIHDAASGEDMKFVTNILKLSPATIAAIYKERWQIELFFKALKQNLKIKTFLGTTANAVRTQIWTALIAMLILKYLRHGTKFSWSLSNLLALLRMSLFSHRNLYQWLEAPFAILPDVADDQQMAFSFA